MAERDLVIDPNETWKQWFTRNLNCEEPPMIPREELPEDKQPHNTFYGRMSNYMSGINPYPPGHRYNSEKPKRRNDRNFEQNHQFEDEKELKSSEMKKTKEINSKQSE